MSKKVILISLLVVTLAFAFTPGDSLAKKSRVPGVTDTSILIGSSAGLSGPIANWGNNMSRFSPQAYFNMVNEQGGIHGRQIKYKVYDDAYKSDRAMANVKKLIWRRIAFSPSSFRWAPPPIKRLTGT